jgi:hypothetical protein
MFESGIHKLINHQQLHNTHYKNIRYKLLNEKGSVKLSIEISYVVEEKPSNANPHTALSFPVEEIIACFSCSWSKITIARMNGFTPIYDHKDPSFKLRTSLSSLISEEFWKNSEVQL